MKWGRWVFSFCSLALMILVLFKLQVINRDHEFIVNLEDYARYQVEQAKVHTEEQVYAGLESVRKNFHDLQELKEIKELKEFKVPSVSMEWFTVTGYSMNVIAVFYFVQKNINYSPLGFEFPFRLLLQILYDVRF